MFFVALAVMSVVFLVGHVIGGAFVQLSIFRREFWSSSIGKRVVVFLAAPIVGYLVAAALCFGSHLANGDVVTTLVVDSIAGPARDAGILDGDRVVSVDGRRIENWEQVPETIRNARGREVEVVVDRNGQEHA